MWDRQDLGRRKKELDKNTLKGLLAILAMFWCERVGEWRRRRDLYKTQK
jgi:hypothetical protein